ncbi:hypothetical protein GPECTOR_49g459 [Gonium pectorale]|uniref:Uncharacterized protein n=1 Tax=Gonium pectorale TaxID=33097 RepID=A0A150G8J0_GONPE|nr:hypothetical protein GPECTOR_49g459 [Gonium pectorale]|eukprot:KXZ45875.1 hypothetical protein GPECTOR_49g459 [Gonium pectorale]
MAVLGFTLSLDKCQLVPKPQVRYLGFVVDAPGQSLRVPDDKVAALGQLVEEYDRRAQLTPRDIAKLAGKIMSMSLAVQLAPLHGRLVAQALASKVSWDEAMGDGREVVRQAQLFLELLRTSNGKCWWRKGPALQLVLAGDASARAYGAFLPDRELGQGEASEMRVPFTEEETALMAAGQFSSTGRELRGLLHALQWLQAQAPQLVAHRRLQYQTDSQPADRCVLGMKGTAACLRVVADIYRASAVTDTEVITVWAPRTEPNQRAADALSKYVDGSQWLLNPAVYTEVEADARLCGRRPVLDLFADSYSTRIPGAFFSRYWCPGTLGVDAFAQHWGGRGLLYANPPFGRMGEVLRKLGDEKADCLLVAPVWPRWWRALLRNMPVRARWELPHRDDLCIPGPQVPNAGGRRPMHPRYRLEVLLIEWS